MFPFDIITKMKAKAYEKGRASGKYEGYEKRFNEQMTDHDKMRLFEVQQFINAPMIVISNEWDNPIVGFGVGIDWVGKSPMIRIMNYITMQEVWCNGVQLPYNRQRLDACLSLEPYDLCAILFGRYGHGEFRKAKTGVRDSNEVILKALEENGFFEKANEFLEKDAKKDPND